MPKSTTHTSCEIAIVRDIVLAGATAVSLTPESPTT
jgi:hypothetical protein